MNTFQATGVHILPYPGPQEQTCFTEGNEAKSQSQIPKVEMQGFSNVSLISVCSSTGVLLSGGTEKDPAGFCL